MERRSCDDRLKPPAPVVSIQLPSTLVTGIVA
jgi:hypothetical protein